MNTWTLIVAALGVAMFIEGLPYFISPRGVRRYMEQLGKLSDGALRGIGLLLMLAGLAVAFLALH